MALTTQPKKPFVVRHLVGSAPVLHGEEKATQTYKQSAFLQDDDAGRITESASPIDASAVTKRAFGMALQDASGVTDKDVPFVWLGPGEVIEITLSDATAGTHTLAQTDKWKVFPITKATNYWYLDANAVSDTGGAVVIGFKDPIGTVDGRVYAVLTNTARGGANAGSGTY